MGHVCNAAKRAPRVLDVVEGTLPSGAMEGQTFRMELRESNDEKTRFVKLTIGDSFRRSYQYTGKNFALAAQQLAEMREALKAAAETKPGSER